MHHLWQRSNTSSSESSLVFLTSSSYSISAISIIACTAEPQLLLVRCCMERTRSNGVIARAPESIISARDASSSSASYLGCGTRNSAHERGVPRGSPIVCGRQSHRSSDHPSTEHRILTHPHPASTCASGHTSWILCTSTLDCPAITTWTVSIPFLVLIIATPTRSQLCNESIGSWCLASGARAWEASCCVERPDPPVSPSRARCDHTPLEGEHQRRGPGASTS